jgi:hypothetical protein
LFVHNNILAASAPYFDIAFSGPWKETQSGLLKTSHSAHIIKAMLTLIYTGKVNVIIVQEQPLAFVSIAIEYGLNLLKNEILCRMVHYSLCRYIQSQRDVASWASI